MRIKGIIIMTIVVMTHASCTHKEPLYSNSEYQMYRDRIVQQNEFEAKALSPTEITSNYQSKDALLKSPLIQFRFCINGEDNEMPSGNDHSFLCTAKAEEELQTPLIRFGEQFVEKREPSGGQTLLTNLPVKFRVDMSAVFDAFEKQGYFTTKTGQKIYQEDFNGVYLAGSSFPLIWDFDNLTKNEGLKLKETKNHIFELNIVLNPQDKNIPATKTWKLSKDISAFPQYQSDFVLENALYNMALEEMCNAVEADSTFRTGKEWAGVWTRDVSYSIILSMAHLQPKVSMNSLMRKVNVNGRIIQDTGTGGAWPVSSDRMIWAIAAWEIYNYTGNGEWLKTIYPIIRNSVEDDFQTVFDPRTGLVKGESSFLDWREQEYPSWMQPADIFESENLGTTAVHYGAIKVLSSIANLMGHPSESEKYVAKAEQIKKAVNQLLWLNNKGFYAQYIYGRNNRMQSPRSETLGEALCVLFGIADDTRANLIIENTPSVNFGTPCFFPNIPDIPPYHNDGIWPFVQTFWMWASAKTGNESGVMHSIGSINRAAAMFLTNKENFVDYSGDWFGTQINSSNMLWSLSGMISTIHHVLFGMRFTEDGLAFEPFVPAKLKGHRSLKNFKYRNATLNIELSGFGNQMISFCVDGIEQQPVIAKTLTGVHKVVIILSNNKLPKKKIKIVENQYTLHTPVTFFNNGTVSWEKRNDAIHYQVLINGTLWKKTNKNSMVIPEETNGEIQVKAIGKSGLESFASEPIAHYKNVIQQEVENFIPKSPLPYKGFSGTGFVEMSRTINRKITIPITVEQDGTYTIDWSYSNGNGPINTENKCAIRTLLIDGNKKGVQIFPQRGMNLWNSWGWSNSISVELSKGEHQVSLEFMPYNENMNITTNQAMLDKLRIAKIK
ncbi:MAG: hypothetical protein ABFC90_02525 [Bacteroidales bacterium]|nr:hypothetical protein [Bacteroidales bacterium]